MKKILCLLMILSIINFSETISEIQGTKIQSSYVNKKVKDVEGIVTYIVNDKYNKGMYIQSETFDDNPNTSEGIYVEYKDIKDVNVGDLVSVSGKVGEKQFAKFDKNRLTVTTIFANDVQVLDVNLKPIITNINGDEIPKLVYDGDFVNLDKKTSAFDFFESLEGMVVKIKEPYVASASEEYGDVYIIPKLARDRAILSENGGILYNKYGNERNHVVSIHTKDSKYWNNKEFIPDFTPNPGDKFKSDIVGVLTNDNYTSIKIYPTFDIPGIEDIGAKVDKMKYSYNEDMINVLTYNVENYSHFSDPRRTVIFAKQIKNIFQTPDIINLVEVGDDDGDKESFEVSSIKNGEALTNAIKRETGIEYGYVAVDPIHGRDGGKPSLHIRNAILYKKDKLKLVKENPGNAYEDTKILKDGKKAYLSLNPGRIANNDSVFNFTRKPLVVQFEHNGKNIYVISLHLSSKRGDDPIFGMNQPPKRNTEVNRHKQAKYVNDFIKELLENDKDATVMVMGDINDYNFSKTTQIIKGDELIDSITELPENERYTYVFEGMSQVLDNIMLNKEYKGNINVDVIRINSEFMKSQGSFSDHDPVFIQFKLK